MNMATLYVRDIPAPLYQQAQKIAQDQGRSLSAYMLTVLQQAVEEDELRLTRAETLSSIRRRRRALPADMPDSVKMIRHIRGENE
jgi:hypothetical protein